jgi:hypothetical protein
MIKESTSSKTFMQKEFFYWLGQKPQSNQKRLFPFKQMIIHIVRTLYSMHLKMRFFKYYAPHENLVDWWCVRVLMAKWDGCGLMAFRFSKLSWMMYLCKKENNEKKNSSKKKKKNPFGLHVHPGLPCSINST